MKQNHSKTIDVNINYTVEKKKGGLACPDTYSFVFEISEEEVPSIIEAISNYPSGELLDIPTAIYDRLCDYMREDFVCNHIDDLQIAPNEAVILEQKYLPKEILELLPFEVFSRLEVKP